MSNKQFDNVFSNTVLTIVGTLVRTMERAIVIFWDGLREATEHGTPSLLGFVAAFLPVIMPLPVAGMTAYSLTTFLEWQPWQALTMAIGIEGAGFVLWVTLVETLIDGGWKGTVMQLFFSGAVLVYEILLIAINAILALQDGYNRTYVMVLFMACLFPALSAISYGYRNSHNAARLDREREEEKQLQEQIRQERREDRKERERMRIQYAADTKREVNPFRGKRS